MTKSYDPSMTRARYGSECIQQLLTLPVSFFRQMEELDEIEEILTRFVGDNELHARILDYSYGGNDGIGNIIKVLLCCQHGSSTGLGISIKKGKDGWHLVEEWNDTYRFCPRCEAYDATHMPSLQMADSLTPCDGRPFVRSFEPSPCI